jgi:hypothetical protein
MAKLKPISRFLLGISGLSALVFVIFVLRSRVPQVIETTLPLTSSKSNQVLEVQQPEAQQIVTSQEISADPQSADKQSKAAMSQQLAQLRADLINPQSRANHLQRARLQVEIKNGRLFQRLAKLEPEKLEKLKTILAEQDVNQRLAALPTDAKLGSDQTVQIPQRLEAARVAADDSVKNLLSADDYARYAAYTDSQAYVETVDQIANVMRSRGVAVGDEQQQAILDAYGSAMKQLGNAIATESNPGNGQPAQASASGDQRLRDMTRFDQHLADAMSKALPHDLFKQFMDAQYAQENASR